MRRLTVMLALCGGLLRLGAMEPAAWKLWYDDGSGVKIFHSRRDAWASIPEQPGVQAILVCYREEWKPGHPYRRVLNGADWYWLDASGEPRKSEGDGAPNGHWTPKPRANAHAGLTIGDAVFERYRLDAMEDTACSVR